MLIAGVVFLFWMYRLHTDLRALFEEYPITPGGALARLLIPIYSLWGIWDTFATLADRLKAEGDALARFGSSLRFWLPWLYVATFISRLLSSDSFKDLVDVELRFVPVVVFIAGIANVFLKVVWLQMARTINSAVH